MVKSGWRYFLRLPSPGCSPIPTDRMFLQLAPLPALPAPSYSRR